MGRRIEIECADHMWHYDMERIESVVTCANGNLEVIEKNGSIAMFAKGYWKKYYEFSEKQDETEV